MNSFSYNPNPLHRAAVPPIMRDFSIDAGMRSFLRAAALEGASGPTGQAFASSLSAVHAPDESKDLLLLGSIARALAAELGDAYDPRVVSTQRPGFKFALSRLCLKLMDSQPLLDHIEDPALIAGMARFVSGLFGDNHEVDAHFKEKLDWALLSILDKVLANKRVPDHFKEQRDWALLSILDKVLANKRVPDRLQHLGKLVEHLPGIMVICSEESALKLSSSAALFAILLARNVFEDPDYKPISTETRMRFLARLMELDESFDRQMEEVIKVKGLGSVSYANVAKLGDSREEIMYFYRIRQQICELVFAIDQEDGFTGMWERRIQKRDLTAAFGHYAYLLIDLCHEEWSTNVNGGHAQLEALLSQTFLLRSEKAENYGELDPSVGESPVRHFGRREVGVYLWRAFYPADSREGFKGAVALLSPFEKSLLLRLMEGSISKAAEFYAIAQPARELTPGMDPNELVKVDVAGFMPALKKGLGELRKHCVTSSSRHSSRH